MGEESKLGHNNTVNYPKPTLVFSLVQYNIVSISLGSKHALTVTDKGLVFAVGSNEYGQTGLGNNASVFTQVESFNGQKIVKVACGFAHSCKIEN